MSCFFGHWFSKELRFEAAKEDASSICSECWLLSLDKILSYCCEAALPKKAPKTKEQKNIPKHSPVYLLSGGCPAFFGNHKIASVCPVQELQLEFPHVDFSHVPWHQWQEWLCPDSTTSPGFRWFSFTNISANDSTTKMPDSSITLAGFTTTKMSDSCFNGRMQPLQSEPNATTITSYNSKIQQVRVRIQKLKRDIHQLQNRIQQIQCWIHQLQ